MKDTIFLFIKVVIQTKHRHIQDAMKELETQYTIGSTANVEVLEAEIIPLNKEQLNKNSHGTQSQL